MNKYLPIAVVMAAAALFAASCAKDAESTTGEDAKAYLEVFLKDNYPGVSANENGVYILEDEPGNGVSWDVTRPYTYAQTTVRYLDGTITSTSDEALSKQLGTYVLGNYYGPKYSATGEGYSYAGVDALLEGMRAGGTRTAIIPAWLLTSSRLESTEEYIKECTNSTHLIYTVKLFGQTDNILQDQTDSLRAYVTRHYGASQEFTPILGSSDYDGHFYFVSDSTAFEGTEHRAESATLQLNYTGRLLNGQVFDTNVEKVAKDAGIYSASKTYTPQSVTFSSTYSDIQMGGSSNLISGFQLGLQKMHWAGQKAVVLFTSPLGYDSSGSGNTIPGYSPLLFELEIF